MPYQTGSSTSPTTLRSAIESFAQTNGWTLSAGRLSQGQNYIRLNDVDAEILTIEGDTDGSFTTGLCPQLARIWIESSLWPVTYRMFAFSSPVFLGVVLQYDVSRFQMLWAGDVVKSASWTGGNWFGATHGQESEAAERVYLDGDRSGGTIVPIAVPISGHAPAAPFWNTSNTESFGGTQQFNRASFLHAEVDGYVWPGAGGQIPVWPSTVEFYDPIHRRQPNVWNSHANLLPIYTVLERADNLWSPLGHVARMRAMKIDNLNPADVIDIGGTRWMVFPWHKKEVRAPDGGLTPDLQANHTGTFGAAFEYDGP